MSGTRKRLLLALAAVLVLLALVGYRSLAFRVNYDAGPEMMSRLTPEQRASVERLIAAETDGMAANEERGLTYYHSTARTGEKNRVYLLWAVAAPGTDLHRAALASPGREAADTVAGEIGLAVYADLGFHSFRTKHGMLLARLFEAEGLRRLRCSCWRRDAEYATWTPIRTLPNAAAVGLLSAEMKRAIRSGSYGAVCAFPGERSP